MDDQPDHCSRPICGIIHSPGLGRIDRVSTICLHSWPFPRHSPSRYRPKRAIRHPAHHPGHLRIDHLHHLIQPDTIYFGWVGLWQFNISQRPLLSCFAENNSGLWFFSLIRLLTYLIVKISPKCYLAVLPWVCILFRGLQEISILSFTYCQKMLMPLQATLKMATTAIRNQNLKTFNLLPNEWYTRSY